MMGDWLDESLVIDALIKMGYEQKGASERFRLFQDPLVGGVILMVPVYNGKVLRLGLQTAMELEGGNIDRFYSELETL